MKFTQTALETKEVWTLPEQKGRETSNCKYFFFFKVDISSIQSVGVTVSCSCSGLLGGVWGCVAAGLCFFLFFLLLVIVAQKKQREHPQNTADGHADGFTLQEEKKKSYYNAKSKNPTLVILLINSDFTLKGELQRSLKLDGCDTEETHPFWDRFWDDGTIQL